MAAKYDFKTSPDIQGEKEQPTLYPQIVVSGTKNLKDLAKDIARCSTVHEGTVVGLLCDLESIIANYLADGYNVKLGELGTPRDARRWRLSASAMRTLTPTTAP